VIIGVDASRALNAQLTGTERYSLEIIRHLLALPEARRHSWRLYLPSEAPAHLFCIQLENVECRILPARRLWTHRALAWEVVRHPPDVLFIPAHVIPLLPPFLLPATVVTLHDVGYRHFPEAHSLSQRIYLELSTRWSAAVARRVIAVSQFTASDLQRFYGTSAGKIRVIYEGADARMRGGEEARRRGGEEAEGCGGADARMRGCEEAKRRGGEEAEGCGGADARRRGGEEVEGCGDADARRRVYPQDSRARGGAEVSSPQDWGAGGARPYALYLGTIQPRKNLARLIEAYGLLLRREGVEWDLVLAGRRGWLSDHLYDLARQGGFGERVHFLGYVPDEQAQALMQNALFFAFPSLFEGFGLPVLEAQQKGVPVMCSNNSALPEVAGDAAILVDPNDVEAIADAMLQLSQDEALRQKLIAAGYENLKRFSWEKAAKETLSVFENMNKE
jgi:glycosyltransferase involved in cell wall biosynthesis